MSREIWAVFYDLTEPQIQHKYFPFVSKSNQTVSTASSQPKIEPKETLSCNKIKMWGRAPCRVKQFYLQVNSVIIIKKVELGCSSLSAPRTAPDHLGDEMMASNTARLSPEECSHRCTAHFLRPTSDPVKSTNNPRTCRPLTSQRQSAGGMSVDRQFTDYTVKKQEL